MKHLKRTVVVILLACTICSCKGKEKEKTEPISSITPNNTEQLHKQDLDSVAIDKERFGSDAFCTYLCKRADGNEDGFLSETERDQVTKIFFDLHDELIPQEQRVLGEVKGLEYFKNLEELYICDADRVEIKRHQRLRLIEFVEGKVNEVVLEECPALEKIWFSESGVTSVFVKDCENLKCYGGEDSSEKTLVFRNTPLLSAYIGDNSTVMLDANAFLLMQGSDSKVNINWENVKENAIALSEEFFLSCLKPEVISENYTYEIFVPIEESIDENGNKLYNVCVTFRNNIHTKEAFPVCLGSEPMPDRCYVCVEDVDALEVLAYSPNRGALVRGKWSLSLRYRDGENEIVLGNMENNLNQIWFLEAEKKPQYFENIEEAGGALGIGLDYGFVSIPMPTATPFPFEMPERKVVKANPEAERISIDKTYFSDEGFREFIKKKIDTDGDGFLSKAEREQVLNLEDPGYYKVGKVVLDGLDWFPNMEHLELMGEAEVFLDHHPSLFSVNWNESGQSAIFIDGCENLEQIDIFMSSNGGVYVNNCRNLKRLSSSDGSLGSLYASGVPKLEICVDWYEEIPKEILLDGDAQIVWRLWDDPEEELRLDNIGVQFKVLEEGVLYWGELFSMRYESQVNWLGVNTSELNLDEQVAQMYAMYNTSIPAEELADDSIRTLTKTILFSPKKASVYMVGSWNESNELLSARYYIVESDGIITEYVSLEEMLEVAEQIEGLDRMKKLFLPGKE